MPQVLSALERKADEPFATLRPVTHSPAVWILNFRVRYTKSTKASGGGFRRATSPRESLCGEVRAFRHAAS
ncbi:hypothetical protein ACPUYX_06480, partial [Desulfosporosinus sp. SYSU MS00001]|uniref:hypothetical protein n=1 Tax=Desulfosporosinus sp. SYSU MS00001 TaxID=3416284 RepID=UPI003CF53342